MGKYWDLINGADSVVEQANPEQPATGGKYWQKLNGQEPAAEAPVAAAKGRGFFGTVKDMVVGKHDPNYQGVGTVFDQFRTELHNPTANAATFGASDPQMADVVQKALGDRFIRREKDANGYDVFVTRGQDGQEQKGYLNAPGLDSQDIARGIRGSLPYAITGGAAYGVAGAAPLLFQAAAQGAAAGLTSLGGDVALQGQGSEQGLELGKAGWAAAGGAAGPYIGRGIDRLLAGRAASGMVDDATGQLRPDAAAAASGAGVDPTQMAPDAAQSFARTFAMSGDASEAAVRSATKPLGIPVSRGQVTKRPDLLTQEEGMRRNLYGDTARQTMERFDKEQAAAINNAALGERIAGRIAPHRAPTQNAFDTSPSVLGTSVREGLQSAQGGAKAGANKAWAEVPQMKATQEALDLLPDTIQKRMTDVIVDENTPNALKMDSALGAFVRGETPTAATQVVKNAPIRDVDRMRRRLLDLSSSRDASPEDRRAMEAMYDGFNDWIGEAAKRNLLNGDPATAAKLETARGFTREVKQLFEPRDARGTLTAGGQRMAKVLDVGRADSPEAVIDSLLGAQGNRSVNQGTVGALKNIKAVLGRYADQDVAKKAWSDIGLAYWVRQVQGRNGELLGPQAMLTNLQSAFKSQRSVVNELYSPQVQAEMQQLIFALKSVAYKPPNASGSGYTSAQFAKQMFAKAWGMIGGNTVLGQMADDLVGVTRRYGTAAARSAVDQSTKLRPNYSPSVPLLSGGASGYGRAQQDN